MNFPAKSLALFLTLTFLMSNPAAGQEEVLMRRTSHPDFDDNNNLGVIARQTAQAGNSEGDSDRKLFPEPWPDVPPFPAVESTGATAASITGQLPLQIAAVPCAGGSCQMESNETFFPLDFGMPTVDDFVFGHAMSGLVSASADANPPKTSSAGASVDFASRIASRVQSMYLEDRDIGDDKLYTLSTEYRIRILEDRIGQQQELFKGNPLAPLGSFPGIFVIDGRLTWNFAVILDGIGHGHLTLTSVGDGNYQLEGRLPLEDEILPLSRQDQMIRRMVTGNGEPVVVNSTIVVGQCSEIDFASLVNGLAVQGAGSNTDWVNTGAGFEVEITVSVSITNEFMAGDMNGDGAITLADVGPFVDAINSGVYNFVADINRDGASDLLDIGFFVDMLLELGTTPNCDDQGP
ncbi:MAG: hypothetical protein AAF456_08575 [Planctomycetota bacterium]